MDIAKGQGVRHKDALDQDAEPLLGSNSSEESQTIAGPLGNEEVLTALLRMSEQGPLHERSLADLKGELPTMADGPEVLQGLPNSLVQEHLGTARTAGSEGGGAGEGGEGASLSPLAAPEGVAPEGPAPHRQEPASDAVAPGIEPPEEVRRASPTPSAPEGREEEAAEEGELQPSIAPPSVAQQSQEIAADPASAAPPAERAPAPVGATPRRSPLSEGVSRLFEAVSSAADGPAIDRGSAPFDPLAAVREALSSVRPAGAAPSAGPGPVDLDPGEILSERDAVSADLFEAASGGPARAEVLRAVMQSTLRAVEGVPSISEADGPAVRAPLSAQLREVASSMPGALASELGAPMRPGGDPAAESARRARSAFEGHVASRLGLGELSDWMQPADAPAAPVRPRTRAPRAGTSVARALDRLGTARAPRQARAPERPSASAPARQAPAGEGLMGVARLVQTVASTVDEDVARVVSESSAEIDAAASRLSLAGLSFGSAAVEMPDLASGFTGSTPALPSLPEAAASGAAALPTAEQLVGGSLGQAGIARIEGAGGLSGVSLEPAAAPPPTAALAAPPTAALETHSAQAIEAIDARAGEGRAAMSAASAEAIEASAAIEGRGVEALGFGGEGAATALALEASEVALVWSGLDADARADQKLSEREGHRTIRDLLDGARKTNDTLARRAPPQTQEPRSPIAELEIQSGLPRAQPAAQDAARERAVSGAGAPAQDRAPADPRLQEIPPQPKEDPSLVRRALRRPEGMEVERASMRRVAREAEVVGPKEPERGEEADKAISPAPDTRPAEELAPTEAAASPDASDEAQAQAEAAWTEADAAPIAPAPAVREAAPSTRTPASAPPQPSGEAARAQRPEAPAPGPLPPSQAPQTPGLAASEAPAAGERREVSLPLARPAPDFSAMLEGAALSPALEGSGLLEEPSLRAPDPGRVLEPLQLLPELLGLMPSLDGADAEKLAAGLDPTASMERSAAMGRASIDAAVAESSAAVSEAASQGAAQIEAESASAIESDLGSASSAASAQRSEVEQAYADHAAAIDAETAQRIAEEQARAEAVRQATAELASVRAAEIEAKRPPIESQITQIGASQSEAREQEGQAQGQQSEVTRDGLKQQIDAMQQSEELNLLATSLTARAELEAEVVTRKAELKQRAELLKQQIEQKYKQELDVVEKATKAGLDKLTQQKEEHDRKTREEAERQIEETQKRGAAEARRLLGELIGEARRAKDERYAEADRVRAEEYAKADQLLAEAQQRAAAKRAEASQAEGGLNIRANWIYGEANRILADGEAKAAGIRRNADAACAAAKAEADAMFVSDVAFANQSFDAKMAATEMAVEEHRRTEQANLEANKQIFEQGKVQLERERELGRQKADQQRRYAIIGADSDVAIGEMKIEEEKSRTIQKIEADLERARGEVKARCDGLREQADGAHEDNLSQIRDQVETAKREIRAEVARAQGEVQREVVAAREQMREIVDERVETMIQESAARLAQIRQISAETLYRVRATADALHEGLEGAYLGVAQKIRERHQAIARQHEEHLSQLSAGALEGMRQREIYGDGQINDRLLKAQSWSSNQVEQLRAGAEGDLGRVAQLNTDMAGEHYTNFQDAIGKRAFENNTIYRDFRSEWYDRGTQLADMLAQEGAAQAWEKGGPGGVLAGFLFLGVNAAAQGGRYHLEKQMIRNAVDLGYPGLLGVPLRVDDKGNTVIDVLTTTDDRVLRQFGFRNYLVGGPNGPEQALRLPNGDIIRRGDLFARADLATDAMSERYSRPGGPLISSQENLEDTLVWTGTKFVSDTIQAGKSYAESKIGSRIPRDPRAIGAYAVGKGALWSAIDQGSDSLVSWMRGEGELGALAQRNFTERFFEGWAAETAGELGGQVLQGVSGRFGRVLSRNIPPELRERLGRAATSEIGQEALESISRLADNPIVRSVVGEGLELLSELPEEIFTESMANLASNLTTAIRTGDLQRAIDAARAGDLSQLQALQRQISRGVFDGEALESAMIEAVAGRMTGRINRRSEAVAPNIDGSSPQAGSPDLDTPDLDPRSVSPSPPAPPASAPSEPSASAPSTEARTASADVGAPPSQPAPQSPQLALPPAGLPRADAAEVAAANPSLAASVQQSPSLAALVASDPLVASALQRWVDGGGRITFSNNTNQQDAVSFDPTGRILTFGPGFRTVPSSRNPAVMSSTELSQLRTALLGGIDSRLSPAPGPEQSGFGLRVDLASHLSRGEGVVNGQISGGHNATEFASVLTANGGRIDSIERASHPGIMEISYRLPARNPDGSIRTDGQGATLYGPAQAKTVYLPGRISDAEMLDLANQAAAWALQRPGRQQTITLQTDDGPISFAVYSSGTDAASGLPFMEITNVHPVVVTTPPSGPIVTPAPGTTPGTGPESTQQDRAHDTSEQASVLPSGLSEVAQSPSEARIRALLDGLYEGGLDIETFTSNVDTLVESATPEALSALGTALMADGKAWEANQDAYEPAVVERMMQIGRAYADATARRGLDPYGRRIERTLSVITEDYFRYREDIQAYQQSVGAWTDMDLPYTMWTYFGNIARYSGTEVHLVTPEHGVRGLGWGKNAAGQMEAQVNADGTQRQSVTMGEVEGAESLVTVLANEQGVTDTDSAQLSLGLEKMDLSTVTPPLVDLGVAPAQSAPASPPSPVDGQLSLLDEGSPGPTQPVELVQRPQLALPPAREGSGTFGIRSPGRSIEISGSGNIGVADVDGGVVANGRGLQIEAEVGRRQGEHSDVQTAQRVSGDDNLIVGVVSGGTVLTGAADPDRPARVELGDTSGLPLDTPVTVLPPGDHIWTGDVQGRIIVVPPGSNLIVNGVVGPGGAVVTEGNTIRFRAPRETSAVAEDLSAQALERAREGVRAVNASPRARLADPETVADLVSLIDQADREDATWFEATRVFQLDAPGDRFRMTVGDVWAATQERGVEIGYGVDPDGIGYLFIGTSNALTYPRDIRLLYHSHPGGSPPSDVDLGLGRGMVIGRELYAYGDPPEEALVQALEGELSRAREAGIDPQILEAGQLLREDLSGPRADERVAAFRDLVEALIASAPQGAERKALVLGPTQPPGNQATDEGRDLFGRMALERQGFVPSRIDELPIGDQSGIISAHGLLLSAVDESETLVEPDIIRFVVPEGRTVTILASPGGTIMDSAGRAIEDYAGSMQRRSGQDPMLAPAADPSLVVWSRTYRAGERAPLTVFAYPEGLHIGGSAITLFPNAPDPELTGPLVLSFPDPSLHMSLLEVMEQYPHVTDWVIGTCQQNNLMPGAWHTSRATKDPSDLAAQTNKGSAFEDRYYQERDAFGIPTRLNQNGALYQGWRTAEAPIAREVLGRLFVDTRAPLDYRGGSKAPPGEER